MMQFGSLQEIIDEHICDGQSVALEGFTHLIPFAAGHEILRQKKRDLHLIRMTPDLIYDQLIGAGCARTLTFSWGGNPGVGSLHRLRDAVENDCRGHWKFTNIPTRGCRSECCAAMLGPISRASILKCAKYAVPIQTRQSLRCQRSTRMSPSCMRKLPIARATFSSVELSAPRRRRRWRRGR